MLFIMNTYHAVKIYSVMSICHTCKPLHYSVMMPLLSQSQAIAQTEDTAEENHVSLEIAGCIIGMQVRAILNPYILINPHPALNPLLKGLPHFLPWTS